MLPADQREHHVQRRGAARARQPVAVDLEQLRRDDDPRKILAHGGHVLPVDRAPVAVEELCPGEQVGACAQGPDRRLAMRRAPQPA